MEKKLNNNVDYWNEFYNNLELDLSTPSQFAAFVATEYLGKIETIIDLGCGNGRDSFFFSFLGFKVLGIDISKQAIKNIKRKKIPNTTFYVGDVSDKNFGLFLKSMVKSKKQIIIYSRFFLHAISAKQELNFWSALSICCQKKDIVTLEFRTIKDQNLEKITAQHYRRFIDPDRLAFRAAKKGFTCKYKVEGVGYAKYKNDDAYVARMIFEKN